jgi:(p)ppGpp synthase/HD superfamily hydrolase
MSTLEKAISIAALAHQGQTDKAGTPYILHPLRLMMRMRSEDAMIAAVLHDVVEDSAENDKWTIERLRDSGFSEEILKAVDCLTKRPGEDYSAFIDRAAANPIAREVKIADLEDNMNMLRMRQVKTKDLERLEKYHLHWSRLIEP